MEMQYHTSHNRAENPREDNTIRRQDLVAFITMEIGHLDWGNTNW